VTGLSVADIERWNPGDVREVFRAARNRAEANQLASHGLATLPVFQTWGGAAADAAKNAVEQTRKDLDKNGHEALAVAMAADRAADGIEAVQAKLKALQADVEQAGLRIDPIANKVVTSGAFKGTAAELAAKQAEFQPRLDAILGEATVIDEELAQAIEMADGDMPISKGSPNMATAGPDGLTPDQVGVDAGQEQNRRDAFRQVYGRDPVSANDWRMADALDPHTYDPRYRGLQSNVVVGRFKPVPGAGVYRQNMYIPAAEVQNFELDPTLQRVLPHMAGDNRGPSSMVPAESSRVTIYADMEHGILVARQNPTMSTDGVEAGTGIPVVGALQGDNGALMIAYSAADPFEPGPAKPIVKVSGTMNIVPTAGGNIAAGGDITQYPSTEAYQYKPDGTTTQLFNRRVTPNQLGALTLALPQTHIGASLPDLPRPWTAPTPDGLPPNAPRLIPTQPLPMTNLDSAANPPTIYTVPVPPPPPIPVAAPPLPVPTPPPLPVPAR
jgi:hypothetical protein